MRSLILVAALGGFLAAGCSKSAETGVPVEGRVQVNGKPAVGAIVTFHPVNAPLDAPRPTSQVGEDGSYRIPAAAPGEYRVTVAWYVASALRKGAYADEAPPVSQLPALYSRPDSTPFTATVRPGQTDPVNFEIKKK